jgi:hypothetical protein
MLVIEILAGVPTLEILVSITAVIFAGLIWFPKNNCGKVSLTFTNIAAR